MDVADVTTAGGGRADARFQAVGEVRFVNVTDQFGDEVTPSNIALAIHCERSFTRGTRVVSAGITLEVPVKVRIYREQPIDLARLIVISLFFERVDPEIHLWTKSATQFVNRIEMFAQSHHTDAVTDFRGVEFTAARDKSGQRNLGRMKGCPEREGLAIGVGQFIKRPA